LGALGLSLGVLLAVPVVAAAGAQDKPATKAAAKPAAAQDRIDGAVKGIDKNAKMFTVRLRGKTMTREVMYDDKTQFTYRNKKSSVDELKDDNRVICLGKLNDKGQLMATRVDVREKM
jgi:hypothetical protein